MLGDGVEILGEEGGRREENLEAQARDARRKGSRKAGRSSRPCVGPKPRHLMKNLRGSL